MHSLDELIETHVKMLRSDGWLVNVESADGSVVIKASHLLSYEQGVSLLREMDLKRNSRLLEATFGAGEFALVRNRPSPCPHESLLGKLRVAGGVNEWSHDIVDHLASILRSEELLTPDECDWLEMAGPIELPSGRTVGG